MKKITSFLCLTFLMLNAQAQLMVAPSNNVGIGTTNPLSKISVNGDGNTMFGSYFYNPNISLTNNMTLVGQTIPIPGSGKCYGVYGFVNLTTTGGYNNGSYGSAYSTTVTNQGRAYGVKGYAGNAGNGWNYGVYGTLAGSNNGAAIYGVVAPNGDVGIPGKYAGYFLGNVAVSSGDVTISGHLGINKAPDPLFDISTQNNIQVATITISSDQRLKTNIQDLSGSLATLTNLKGVTYNLNKDAEVLKTNSLVAPSASISDTGTVIQPVIQKIDNPIYTRSHIGFLAQDVQKVFPELVYEDKDGILSVDYVSLIPVLVESLKEVNQKIEGLIKENAILKKKLGL